MKKKDYLFIILAVIIAIIAPFFLMGIIYPCGKVFLPPGNIVLTFPIRFFCTIVMAVIDYSLAYVFIHKTPKSEKKLFNITCFSLTFLWNFFIGFIWYIYAID